MKPAERILRREQRKLQRLIDKAEQIEREIIFQKIKIGGLYIEYPHALRDLAEKNSDERRRYYED